MKTPLKSILCTGMSLFAAAALAQDHYNNQSSSSGTANDSSGNQSYNSATTPQPVSQTQEFFDAKKFIGTDVKDSQGKSMSEIKDIVFNPSSGEVFAAFNVSNYRYALVPWQALSITTTSRDKYQVTLSTTKQELENGPTVPRNQLQQLNNPTFTQSIYAHYNLQAPTPMGGGGTHSLGGKSSGSGQQNQNPSVLPSQNPK